MVSRRYNPEHRRQELLKRIQLDIRKPWRALQEDLGGDVDADRDITASCCRRRRSALSPAKPVFLVNAGWKRCLSSWAITFPLRHVEDGQPLVADQLLFELQGPARLLLTAERTALNFVQTLSGVATAVNRYVALLSGSNTQLLDTRKTLPGCAPRSSMRCCAAAGRIIARPVRRFPDQRKPHHCQRFGQ